LWTQVLLADHVPPLPGARRSQYAVNFRPPAVNATIQGREFPR